MAEKPEDIQEDAPETPVDDVTLAEAEIQASADAPADDAAALTAADEPDAAVAEEAPAPAGPKGPATQEPVSIEERAERRTAERKRKAAQRSRFRARAKERRNANRVETTVTEDHAPEHGPGRPKTRQGIVLSAKPDKTISVKIDVATRHPRYHKIMRTSSTLHVHDERNDANEGDTVRVVECRPMSRTKRWRLVEVVERAR